MDYWCASRFIHFGDGLIASDVEWITTESVPLQYFCLSRSELNVFSPLLIGRDYTRIVGKGESEKGGKQPERKRGMCVA